MGGAPAGSISIPPDLWATLVLVRHGQSTFVAEGRFQGRLDPPLSVLGERQAALVAGWLGSPGGPAGLELNSPPAEVVHSPLARAARSAELITLAIERRFGTTTTVSLRPEPLLVEISQGEWEGRTHAEVAERWADVLAAWQQTPTLACAPGGESLTTASGRVRRALPGLFRRLAPPPDDGSARAPSKPRRWSIVVAHDGVLRILLLALLDLPLERFWAFPFALSGATVIDLADGRAALRAHNLSSHLDQAGDTGPAAASLPDRGGAL
jgi:probable phosphoglycerate mutase